MKDQADLCGIGFTMSIFIAYAAFRDPETLALAKLSTILASVAAAIFGWTLLRGAPLSSAAEAPGQLDVSANNRPRRTARAPRP